MPKVEIQSAIETNQEFLEIVNQIELADAERLRNRIELAQLRTLSVDALMYQLDKHPPQTE